MNRNAIRLCLFALVALIFLAAVQPVSAEEKERPTKKKSAAAKSASVKSGKRAKAAKPAKPVAKPSGPKAAGSKAPATVAAAVPAAEAVPAAKPAAIVTGMRHWSTPDYTRIAVSLNRETEFEQHRLPKDEQGTQASRLYIDIAGKIGPGVKDLAIGDNLLKGARIGQFKPDTVRVVLDLDSVRDYKIFTFSDPFRIIIDVKGERRMELAKPPETVLAPLLPERSAARSEPVEEQKRPTPARGAISKVRRIVVDAGHGGHDPGAIGFGGTKEKDVVLQIALNLAHRLREELGLDVVLTRSTDVFLELQERTAIANKVGADLFVSVHANASPNRSTSGIETYYLNLAKTEKVAQLAAKENGTSLEKVSLLQAVLFDLMANYKLNDSAHLAEEVQKTLHRKMSGSYPGCRNLGVKQGPFYVLVGATMPSILVEVAFLSNEREEERLRDPQYLDATAEGIMEGIRAYVASVK